MLLLVHQRLFLRGEERPWTSPLQSIQRRCQPIHLILILAPIGNLCDTGVLNRINPLPQLTNANLVQEPLDMF